MNFSGYWIAKGHFTADAFGENDRGVRKVEIVRGLTREQAARDARRLFGPLLETLDALYTGPDPAPEG